MTDPHAVDDARALLGRARAALGDIRARAPALTAQLAWRSRAAEEFTDALADWVALLERIGAEIDRWEHVVVTRAAGAASSVETGLPRRPVGD